MKTTRRFAAIAMASVAVVAGFASVGSAKVDTTGPTLHASFHPRFEVGRPLVEVGRPGLTGFGGAPVILRTHQADASGVCTEIVKQLRVGDFPSTLVKFTYPHEVQRIKAVASFYDGEQGGNSQRITGWITKSIDCVGNSSRWFTSASTAISDDAGADFASGHTTLAAANYSGYWTARAGHKLAVAHYAEGTLHVSTELGASASLSVTSDGGSHFGLVMPTGSGAGTVDVEVDGVVRRSVDLSSSEPRTPLVVADVRLSEGSHSISVVKTSSDDWVGIDAFMLTSGVVLLGGLVPGPL